MGEERSLGYYGLVIRSLFYLAHLGRIYSSDQNSLTEKRPLAIAAMNVDLPPFKKGKHNSESVSTLDLVFIILILFHLLLNNI